MLRQEGLEGDAVRLGRLFGFGTFVEPFPGADPSFVAASDPFLPSSIHCFNRTACTRTALQNVRINIGTREELREVARDVGLAGTGIGTIGRSRTHQMPQMRILLGQPPGRTRLWFPFPASRIYKRFRRRPLVCSSTDGRPDWRGLSYDSESDSDSSSEEVELSSSPLSLLLSVDAGLSSSSHKNGIVGTVLSWPPLGWVGRGL